MMRPSSALLALALLASLGASPSYARESGVADQVVQSSVASEFSRGIAEGRIEIVEFTSNPRCMNGRVRKKAQETAQLDCGPLLRGYLFKAERPKGLLLVVHGMQSNAGWFLSGDELAAQGIEVLAFDRRGSGISGGTRGHVDDSAEFIQDMTGGLEFLRNRRRDVPIHLHANCFGTRIAIPYMQEHMERITRGILQDEAKAANSNISKEELDWIGGFKFASVINTSPATHMAYEVEKSLMDDKCMMQYVKEGWDPPAGCFAKKYDDLQVLKNGVAEFAKPELACLVDYFEKNRQRANELECSEEMVKKIGDPAQNGSLTELELKCLDNVAYANDEAARQKPNACTPEKMAKFRGTQKDPKGVNLSKSPLTDEMFTTEPHFLSLAKADTTSTREISRLFMMAAYNLATRMEVWLKGKKHEWRILSSGFNSSVLMVLSKNDVMVYNDEIVHEVFQALPAAAQPLALKNDAINDCYACNPRVVGPEGVDKNRCIPQKLLACKYPQDVVECVDPKGEIVGKAEGDKVVSWKDPSKPFVRCADIRLIQTRPPRFPVPKKTIKQFLEIECEHFMEFCKDRSQTERYRKAMADWLLLDRWQGEWREKFE